MEPNDEEMSTTKKVVAGAAVGVAVPAAVGIAKKFIGGEEENGSGQADGRKEARSATRTSGSSTRSGQARSTGSKSRATGRTRSGTSKKTSPKSRPRPTAATRTRSTPARSGAERTKEQLYREAKRLNIDGRSKMSKAQLERAVSRAR